MASWEFRRRGEQLTISLVGQLSESETAVLLQDLEMRLDEDVAGVVFDGATKTGIGPHFSSIKLIGQVARSHGKVFTVRPI